MITSSLVSTGKGVRVALAKHLMFPETGNMRSSQIQFLKFLYSLQACSYITEHKTKDKVT